MNEHGYSEQSTVKDTAPKPVFEVPGVVTIPFLSTSSEGFQLVTKQSLARHTPGSPLPEAARTHGFEVIQRRVSTLYPRATEKISDNLAFEDLPRESLETLQQRVLSRTLTNGQPEVLDESHITRDHGLLRLQPGFRPLVGLRNIEQQGNTLLVDTKPVTYRSYFSLSSPTESQESLEVANPTGTACILFTTEDDGSRKIILQYRSPYDETTRKGNRLYGGIPGASIAGMLDGQLDPANRGKLIPLTTDSVKANNLQELEEEFGLDPHDIFNVKLTGIAEDKIRIHKEAMLTAKTHLSANTFAEKVAQRNGNDTEFHFAEQFLVIDGTPEAVATLLTQVKVPLPPTHTAAFFAAGYALVLERDGVEKAEAWKQKIQQGMEKNYRNINARATTFWHNKIQTAENPQKLLEQLANVNIFGYDPSLPPGKQGLPSIQSELERTELIEKHVAEALLLDIDGVVTNPSEKRITNEKLLDDFTERLQKGEVVGFNTGRSLEWMKQEVLQPLENKLAEKNLPRELLRNIIAIGEKGGAWVTYSLDGAREEHIDPTIRIPEDLQNQIRNLLEYGYKDPQTHDVTDFDTMFDDVTKQTMLSIEMHKGLSHEEESPFKLQQVVLKEAVEKILSRHPRGQEFKVDATTIATDIENTHVGKAHGADVFLNILKERKISVGQFLAFGDSKSDIEMAEELTKQNQHAMFVYVGKGNPWEGKSLPFTLDVTYAGQFENGTTAFIESLKSN